MVISAWIRRRFHVKYTRGGDGECWLWNNAVGRDGYGWFNIDGKIYGAHTIAYRVHVGPIPKGMHVHHTCENPACVNPAHLELLTPAEHRLRHRS